MANPDKMICARCQVGMNHHCDKLVYSNDSHDAGPSADLGLGGFIEEFHTCPQCGDGASRHAGTPPLGS
jgi:ribosomal protein S27AE